MQWPKKNSYKEFDNEKKFLRLETPPPHNFSNGPSLNSKEPSKGIFTEGYSGKYNFLLFLRTTTTTLKCTLT